MFPSAKQFQHDNREEKVNPLLKSFTQDFVGQFEKKLIDYYQEVMGEMKKTSGWLREKVAEKAGEYAPGLGEKAGENIGRAALTEVKNRVCDYVINIKDYLSGKAHKSKAERIVELTAFILLDNKPEFRKILVDAAIDVFRSFESQFARITADSGSMIVMRKNLTVDTVERVLDYIDNQKQNDPTVKISSEIVTKGVIFSNSKGCAIATFKFSQPGSSLKKGNNTDECGHRLLLDWEEKDWNSKWRYQYEVDTSSPTRRYNYVLKAEDLKQKSFDILKDINDKDSVLKLERKDLVDAAEEGARRALNIQQSSRSSCFVMQIQYGRSQEEIKN
ncbi:hypothetical protein TNCV_4275581 [Trichonephila clavipes]|nr:hypothetical protein TNCV_4275581 [Trichonephila clavipes]